jgi:sialic acid synthase SpsE/sugar phosphate isomerase/epimerase
MLVEKKIINFICSPETLISDALQKINQNKSRIIFVVDEKNTLLGSFSDGDFRRNIPENINDILNSPVSQYMNSKCRTVNKDLKKFSKTEMFKDGVDIVPALDKFGRIAHLILKSEDNFKIGIKNISQNHPCFIIAEIGNNHQGSMSHAKQLIDAALAADVDCVKFQLRNNSKLYGMESLNDVSADLGAQYTMDLLNKFQLKAHELYELFDYCKANGVMPMCTPWDTSSLSDLEDYGMQAYKVASADFTNFELLEQIAKTGKPMICSTGMSSEAEIKNTIEFLEKNNANYALLHCNSTYPTPYRDVKLNYLSRLSKLTSNPVGYSGHERGISIPLVAVGLGARIIEKHITLDRNQEGTDHKVSLLPSEFEEMVKQIRNVEAALGPTNYVREITQGEMINRENLAKSVVTKINIGEGQIIQRNMLEIVSPGQGLQPNRIDELVGRRANREIKRGSCFYETDIVGQIRVKERYQFRRKVGVPVRFHDYERIISQTKLDFVEFHLSYQDLDVQIDAFIKEKQNIEMAVHCPELFANDHILDLASFDKKYRNKSISYLQQVIDKTMYLKSLFPKTKNPVLVLNAGGWTKNSFCTEDEKREKYLLMHDALSRIEKKDVTIAIQTMPPFPWHFGGQSFHNLFVDPDEIKDFCEQAKVKVCLDTSHTMMASNYYGWSFEDAIKKISTYTEHMHVVDADGIDGEGVRIGDGDIDFQSLFNILNLERNTSQFIPEIWQGHKNDGEGFWAALNFLEHFETL